MLESIITKVLGALALLGLAFLYVRGAKSEAKAEVSHEATAKLLEEVQDVNEIRETVSSSSDDELLERMRNRARE